MLDELREKLLREGVKPGVVGRYLAELEDHLDDLGQTRTREEALRRLGSADALVAAMLAQPGVRSWTARAPWATLALGPLLGFVFLCFLPTLALYLGAREFAADKDWPLAVARFLVTFNEYVLPILVGWLAVIIALRQRAGLAWLLTGAVLIALLGGGLIEHINLRGNNFGFGFEVLDPFTTVMDRSFETMLFNLIAILAPYVVLRHRMARSA